MRLHRIAIVSVIVFLGGLASAASTTVPASAPVSGTATTQSVRSFASPAEALKDCPKDVAPPKGQKWTKDNDDKYHQWSSPSFAYHPTLRVTGKLTAPMAANSASNTLNIDAGTAPLGDQTVKVLIIAHFPDELRAKARALKKGDTVTIEAPIISSEYQRDYTENATIYFVLRPAAFK
jgi:hypothetical protein